MGKRSLSLVLFVVAVFGGVATLAQTPTPEFPEQVVVSMKHWQISAVLRDWTRPMILVSQHGNHAWYRLDSREEVSVRWDKKRYAIRFTKINEFPFERYYTRYWLTFAKWSEKAKGRAESYDRYGRPLGSTWCESGFRIVP